MLFNKLTSIVDYVCLLWVGDNDRDQITGSYVVMAKDLKCFLGLTFILAQQPLQILQASCAHQDKLVGASFIGFFPSAMSYNVRHLRILTYASSRHPCSKPFSPCHPPHVILDPSQPTKASPHPDLACRQSCGSTTVLNLEAAPAKQPEERVTGADQERQVTSLSAVQICLQFAQTSLRNIRHANR